MFLLILKLMFGSLSLYSLLVSANFFIIWLDNKVSLANGKAGYTSAEPLLRLAFAKSHHQIKKLSFWSKKGVEKLIEIWVEKQNIRVQLQRYNTALNSIINELTYKFEETTKLKITNSISYNGWYLYIPVTKQISGNELSNVESYLLGVVSKYTSEFAVDSVTCQNLQKIGWCLIVQLNYDERAKFNRLARQQEVLKYDDFDDEDEVF